eukprot:938443-Pleurochrysis_carterae.AAC.3
MSRPSPFDARTCDRRASGCAHARTRARTHAFACATRSCAEACEVVRAPRTHWMRTALFPLRSPGFVLSFKKRPMSLRQSSTVHWASEPPSTHGRTLHLAVHASRRCREKSIAQFC